MTKNVLHEADNITNGARPSAYGRALEDYECTAAMWAAMIQKANPSIPPGTLLITPELAAAMMAAMKLSRFAFVSVREVLEEGGITDKSLDSLVDGCGYLRVAQLCTDQRRARGYLDALEPTAPAPGGLDTKQCSECGGREGTHMMLCSKWECRYDSVATCPHPDCKTHGSHLVKKGGPQR